MAWYQKSESSIVIPFAFLLSIPLLGLLFGNLESVSLSEKRDLAVMPSMPSSLSEWEEFPTEMDRFLEDHYGFREAMVFPHGLIQYFVFGLSTAENVVVGDDNWLFLFDKSSEENYRRMRVFSDAELERWTVTLQNKTQWMSDREIGYVFAVVPDKQTVYPEFMPGRINRLSNESMIDQFDTATNSIPSVYNLREPLIEGKEGGQVYFPTDSHWNDLGAYIGYQVIMNGLGLEPLALMDFEFIDREIEGQDLANMIGLRDVIGDKWREFVNPANKCKIESRPPFANGSRQVNEVLCPDGNGQTLLVFHDSFGRPLLRFFPPHFSRSIFIWDYPDYHMMEKAITTYRPDYIIEERVERHMQPFTPDAGVEANYSASEWECGEGVCKVSGALTEPILTLINEFGSSVAAEVSNGKITVPYWNNLVGELNEDRNELKWSNGSVWLKLTKSSRADGSKTNDK